MDLLLWRHAEAVEGLPDSTRELTERGVRQAHKVAEWLESRRPKKLRVLVSPTVRTRQTASAFTKVSKPSAVMFVVFRSLANTADCSFIASTRRPCGMPNDVEADIIDPAIFTASAPKMPNLAKLSVPIFRLLWKSTKLLAREIAIMLSSMNLA